jgi:hypothetical protein
MSGQIIFFEKNIVDLSNESVTLTVTDVVATDTGQDYIDFLRNRNNTSAWMTTGSTDAADTEIEVDFGEETDISEIILIKQNFKAYTIKYWDGDSWENFSTTIAETNNTAETKYHSFTQVATEKIQIIIDSTFVVDDQKEMYQLIVTNKILTGTLNGWPMVKNPTSSLNKIKNKMLSGRVNVIETVGSFSVDLEVSSWRDDEDLTLMEHIFFQREGVLLWLCGGDETQFSTIRVGYRLEDIYLVRPTSEWEPEYYKGLYKSGVVFRGKFEESIN